MTSGACKELLESASEVIDHEAAWTTKARLKAHLLICKHCRRYFKQLEAICGAVGQVANEEQVGEFDEAGQRVLEAMFSDKS